MKRLYMVLLPIAVITCSVLGAWLLIAKRPAVGTDTSEKSFPLVEITEVQLQTVEMTVDTQGTVTPRTESSLVPEVSGRVVSVSPSLAAGGFFEAGEALLSLDRRDFELAVITAKARLAQAELALAQEEAEAEIARSEWADLGVKDREPSPLTLRQPQLAEAKANLESARAALEQAERDLKRTEIRAPYAGRVREEHVDVGQYVTRGTAIGRIYAVDYAEIRLPIVNQDLAFLDLPLVRQSEGENNVGPDVLLTAYLGGKQYEWNGRIVRTEGEIDPRTRMVYVVAQVENPYSQSDSPNRPPLAVGLFVDAKIHGKLVSDLMVLPRTAIRGEEQDHVLVVDAENRLRFRKVEVLRRQDDQVFIRSGLENGEKVCLSPLEVAVEGMTVRIAPSEITDQQASEPTK